MFSVDANNTKKTGKELDVVYYDELARQEKSTILTIDPINKYTGPSASDQKNPIPLEEVIRTKWTGSTVGWNGRTRIL